MIQIWQAIISSWSRDMYQMILVEMPSTIPLIDVSFHVKNGDPAQG
jgi:hypothetical protein